MATKSRLPEVLAKATAIMALCPHCGAEAVDLFAAVVDDGGGIDVDSIDTKDGRAVLGRPDALLWLSFICGCGHHWTVNAVVEGA